MASVWITYAWNDNENHDIDFIAQELKAAGVTVKLDRWNIGAGKRLWEQIEGFIVNPKQSDAWILVATNSSLQSEPCKEEFAYALSRALSTRGGNYPVIGLFLGPVDDGLIPAGIKTRLYVSATDPNWKERIVATAEGRDLKVGITAVEPYYIHVYEGSGQDEPFIIEVRPRAGVWAPFIAAIPSAEKDLVSPSIMIGPRDRPTTSGALTMTGAGVSPDGNYWFMFAGNEATPTQSYYVACNKLPSRLIFGVEGRAPQYEVNFHPA